MEFNDPRTVRGRVPPKRQRYARSIMMYRNLIRTVAILCVTTVTLTAGAQSRQDAERADRPAETANQSNDHNVSPLIQLAILLDNSGSMSGLIEQAKSELWRVVNELTTARHGGRQPRLQVALYLYGDPPPQQLNALTDDLDKVSESLFAVAINGGSEYCGQAIEMAARELAWSTSPHDLKLIFIAGNEPFTQGPVDYREACREAIAKGIIVNTIHCGDGIPDDWRDGALLADGKCIGINQNAQVAHIEAPQDAEIARLGVELNQTYLPYGNAAAESQMRQVAQDGNAAAQSPGSSVQRAVAKANAFYRNSGWDLVDAIRDETVRLADVKTEDLPESMRGMSAVERQKYVTQQSDARQRLQERINTLNTERNRFVAEKQQESAAQSGASTLDQALVQAIRSQASQKQFTFAVQ
jgi:hypothetical protein